MKTILVMHLDTEDASYKIELFNEEINVIWRGCNGDLSVAESIIKEHDGKVDAIALQGMSSTLRLGPAEVKHQGEIDLLQTAKLSPTVDGTEISAALENLKTRPLLPQRFALQTERLSSWACVRRCRRYTARPSWQWWWR